MKKATLTMLMLISISTTISAWDKMSDKGKHFFMGAGITWIVGALAESVDFPLREIALGAGISSGAAKELWDMLGYGEPDITDLLMTWAGSCTAYYACILSGSKYKNYTVLGSLTILCAVYF
ncbi:hypothetical protein WKV44_05780 [Spirochaetia bacterium 38H-sp]|uniref:Uncharacterized protein n=1 Tax=Rarispira pelagica TaxID=3141764 RepID=A0ABU9UC62_9SPIR